MSAEAVRVRSARPEDLAAIGAIDVAVFERSAGTVTLARALTPTDPRCWVAVVDGDIRGYLSAVVVAGEIEIHDLAVDPAFRRRGVARDLVRHVLLEAAGSGSSRAVLEVGDRNRAARALYERCGFRPCGRRKGYYRGGAEDAWILERRLP